MNYKFTSAAFVSFAVLIAIVISGLHVKDVLAVNEQAKLQDKALKKLVTDSQIQPFAHKVDADHSKVTTELHTHVDKQIVKSLVKNAVDHPIDSRSLRQLERAREFYESVRPVSLWQFLGFYIAARVTA